MPEYCECDYTLTTCTKHHKENSEKECPNGFRCEGFANHTCPNGHHHGQCRFLTPHYGGHYFHDGGSGTRYCTLSHQSSEEECEYGYCLLFWLECCEKSHPKQCQYGTLKNCANPSCKLTHLDTFPCIKPDCKKTNCCASHNKLNKYNNIIVCLSKRCSCINFHPKKFCNDRYHKNLFKQYSQLIEQNYTENETLNECAEALIEHFEKVYIGE